MASTRKCNSALLRRQINVKNAKHTADMPIRHHSERLLCDADLKPSSPMEVGSLQLRRSTDNGDSWSPLQSLFVGNIDFYTTVHDAVKDEIWLMLEHESRVEVLHSTNNGESWDVQSPLQVDLPVPFKGGQLKPSVGHGIQLRSNSTSKNGASTGDDAAGRLILPFVCTNTSAPKPSGDTGTCPG